MTTVIFGGCGFIGRHLAHALDARKAGVIILADIVQPAGPIPDSASYVYCDVRQPIALDVEPDPVVFNLAAVHRTPGHADNEYFDTNVVGANNITDFCVAHDVARVTFTSSIAVYGPSEEPVSETTKPAPNGAYGRSKLEAEGIHLRWVDAAPGRQLVIARPGTIFGAGEQGNFTRLAAALARRRFVYPGRRDTVKACGYIDDLVESFAFAQSLAQPSVTYNFGFPQPPTIEDVCHAFCDVGGFPRPRIVIPTRAMLLVAKALTAFGAANYDGERVLKLVRSTNIVPEVLVREGYKYRFDLRSALADWYSREPAGQFI